MMVKIGSVVVEIFGEIGLYNMAKNWHI